ncbi:hypothetical protein ZIOFF_016789 [Zingiber officinale]|uniref:Uncharacterized protein n=1 Tax=Zingiber officinale TaxID=94328 RepID=A0A8J5I216_ZINOF|nr:hypothetical protein ZIOFF_016789 [Zingiber officinale]
MVGPKPIINPNSLIYLIRVIRELYKEPLNVEEEADEEAEEETQKDEAEIQVDPQQQEQPILLFILIGVIGSLIHLQLMEKARIIMPLVSFPAS